MIRPIIPNDYNKNYLSLLNQLSYTPHISFDEFIHQINTYYFNSQYTYVHEANDQIIATGTLCVEHKISHQCGKVGHIEDIVVDKSYRGKGIGNKMIKYLVEKAKEKDCYKVCLNCNSEIKDFYIKLGFVEKNSEMILYF